MNRKRIIIIILTLIVISFALFLVNFMSCFSLSFTGSPSTPSICMPFTSALLPLYFIHWPILVFSSFVQWILDFIWIILLAILIDFAFEKILKTITIRILTIVLILLILTVIANVTSLSGLKCVNSESQCYYNMALEKNSLMICNFVHDDFSQSICYTKIASLRGDTSLCYKKFTLDGSTNNIASLNGCLSNVAQAKNDSSICSDIKDEYLLNECFSKIAYNINNAELCSQTTTDKDEGQCLLSIARIRNDMTICESIQYQEKKDSCYYNFALDRKESSLCKKIINPSTYNYCLMYAGNKT